MSFIQNLIAGTVVIPKASGNGIKVDLAAPTFGWRDMIGPVGQSNTGSTKPTQAVYMTNIKQFQYEVGNEAYVSFHMPHDYVEGTDIFFHYHWSHNVTTVTGGSVTFGYNVTYSKGHNQAAFAAAKTGTVVGNASTTRYQHIITELQLSAASPSAAQLTTTNLEVDGLIIMTAKVTANNITVSDGGVPDPFIHFVDIHYQSSGIATKQKAPPFFV